MNSTDITREELWAQQNLSVAEIDYSIWERDRSMLHQISKISHTCTLVVDVYKCRYAFASPNFTDLLGYDSHKIATLEKQGDYLESRIHPDDRQQLADLQIRLGQFIYSLPAEKRNDYCNIYSFRVHDARQQYIRVISKQQVRTSRLHSCQPQKRRNILPIPSFANKPYSTGDRNTTSYPTGTFE